MEGPGGGSRGVATLSGDVGGARIAGAAAAGPGGKSRPHAGIGCPCRAPLIGVGRAFPSHRNPSSRQGFIITRTPSCLWSTFIIAKRKFVYDAGEFNYCTLPNIVFVSFR